MNERLIAMTTACHRDVGSHHDVIKMPSFLYLGYLGSDGGGCDVRGGTVLRGGHAAVLLLLLLFLTLHPLILRLSVGAAGGGRGQRGRRRGKVLQLIGHLLHFDHSFSQKIDGVRESGQDELKTFLHERETEQKY